MKKTNRGAAHRITLRLIPIVLIFAAILAACGAPATATPVIPETGPTEAPMTEAATEPAAELPATIKVGVVVPLTGRYAAGIVRNGMLAAEDIQGRWSRGAGDETPTGVGDPG
jgi:hypothetical protein